MEFNFRQYTGTKTLLAAPMGAAEAARCGANLTEATVRENLGNHGYLVQYPDGYRSWSPAKIFEAAYRLSETPLDRMQNELSALAERICNATKTLYSVGPMSEYERYLLKDQLEAMQRYAAVLCRRVLVVADGEPVAAVSCGATTKGGE